MEVKTIGSGHGWRIVCREFQTVSWDRTRYKPGVIVVRLPNSRHDYFMCTAVVTEGVSGQPQLTFDDPAKAQEYCDRLNRVSNLRHWEITKTRGTYECYKIPLNSNQDAWLAKSNFPPEGSEEWKHLCDLYPDYFKSVSRGFFNEDLDSKRLEEPIPSVSEVERIMFSTDSEENKCQKLFNVSLEDLQRLARRNFDSSTCPIEDYYFWTWMDVRGGGGAAFWSLFVHYDYGEEQMNLTDSFLHYCKNQRQGLYSGYSKTTLSWWANLEATIEYWATQGDDIRSRAPVRGFFTESIDTNLTREDVWAVMLEPNLNGTQKSQILFGRPEDYIAHVQYMALEPNDSYGFMYIKEHDYFTPEALSLPHSDLVKALDKIGKEIRSNTGTDIRGTGEATIHVCTVFWDSAFIGTLKQSWNHYVHNIEEGFSWYKYIKHSVNKFEDSGLISCFKPKRGFFMESLVGRELTGEEIINIMEADKSLDEKSFELFGKGRDAKYVEDLNYGCFRTETLAAKYNWNDKLPLSEVNQLVRDIQAIPYANQYEGGTNETGKRTVFVDGGLRKNLWDSWIFFVRENNFPRSSVASRFGPARRALAWWKFITYSIEKIEATGQIYDMPQAKVRGFFAD